MHLNYYRAGSGEPLVLIHGLGLRWQTWEPVLPRLTAERDVVVIDLPGFADSPPPPPGAPASIASLSRLVGEFLDQLGLERPHVAGNSLGGWLSLELAQLGRARSATALSPAGFGNQREREYARIALGTTRKLTRLIAPQADRLVRSRAGRALLFPLAVYRPLRLRPEAAARIVRGFASAVWFDEVLATLTNDRFTGGDQLQVPVTIAWGEHDRLQFPRQAGRAARAIPSARVITLRGCGHVPMSDDPEQVARVLLEGSAGG